MLSQTRCQYTTFDDFNWTNITCIQDPVYEAYIDLTSYFDIYDMLLSSLDGTDDKYIETYFVLSPLNNRLLVFRDRRVRTQFGELAMCHGLIPPLKEFHEGESNKEKNKRTRTNNIKRPLLTKTNQEIAVIKMDQMIRTLDKLRSQLDGESDPFIRSKLNDKISKISDALNNPSTV